MEAETGAMSSPRKVALLDLDGVVFPNGSDEMLPNAKEGILKLAEDGYDIYLFSCGANKCRVAQLTSFVRIHGAIAKPLADEYLIVDDKINLLDSTTGFPE